MKNRREREHENLITRLEYAKAFIKPAQLELPFLFRGIAFLLLEKQTFAKLPYTVLTYLSQFLML